MTAIQRPVFYDPTARRWRVLKRVLFGLGAVVGTLLGDALQPQFRQHRVDEDADDDRA